MTRLPEEYLDRMKSELKEEFASYLAAMEEPRLNGLRVNTLKITPEEFISRFPLSLTPVLWTRNGFTFEGDEKPAKFADYFAGLYYLQEPSAMTPAAYLPVEPGDRVLDLCAAPGGKSTELAARLAGTGVLFANDVSVSRSKALLKNIELFGTVNAVVLSEEPARILERFPASFDKILIDAPCSGEGMFRKDPAVVKSWMEHGNGFYTALQRKILESAVKLLKPGGLLLYSTCTFAEEEDEGAVLYALGLDPSLEIIPFEHRYEAFDPGRTLIDGKEYPFLKNAIRIYPHHVKGEGHFLALLQKNAGSGNEPHAGSPNAFLLSELPGFRDLPKEAGQFLSQIKKRFYGGILTEKEGRVSLLKVSAGELKGLRVLRNGLFLGTVEKGRFEPSQALAMALSTEDYPSVLSFPAGDGRILRYLKGETLTVDPGNVPDGWVLIALDRFPLGFAKAKGDLLKNKYLPGWRYQ